MNKLRKFRARAFRGARFDLPLDFTDKLSSVAVFGDNASGKSTIADALEWLFVGSVDYLWREDCKEEALRNVLAESSELSEVEVEFNLISVPLKKTLDADLKTIVSNPNKNLLDVLKILPGERTFLRHSQITEFISKTKSEKKAVIASIIGYQKILDFREAIQSAKNSLVRDSDYISGKARAESAAERLLKRSGSVIVSRSQLHTFASKYVSQFGLVKTITNAAEYLDAVEKLKGHITDPERAQRRVRLSSLRSDCNDFRTRLDEIVATIAAFSDQYAQFSDSSDAATKIKVEHFLSVGHRLIKDGTFSEDTCPFCLSEKVLSDIEMKVGARIDEIVALKTQFDTARTLHDKLQSLIADAEAICSRIAKNYNDVEGFQKLTDAAGPTLSALDGLGRNIRTNFAAIEPLQSFAGQVAALNHFGSLAKSFLANINAAITELELSTEEAKLVDAVELLRDLNAQIDDLESGQITKRIFEDQIFTLSTVLEQFLAAQNKALQVVLDRISKDVAHLYGKLHPGENVDKIRLRVVGENGIEFEYEFHGVAAQPPLKYLSESHLNSLGICLFLASAKLFNKSSRLLVLDDIVTSFDINHRRRLLRLLKEEFSDWQIVLLTHEHLWFDVIKKEMAQENWQFKEVEWDSENGIRLNESAASLRKFIDEKRKTHDVSNDVRKLIESTAKELCHALEVRLPFRFNETNERRTSGELLSALRGTVTRKSLPLKNNPIFQQIEGSSLVANVGSHDNPSETVAAGDIDVALSDIDTLTALFSCQHCKRFVEANRPIPGKNRISCKCGKTELDWKD